LETGWGDVGPVLPKLAVPQSADMVRAGGNKEKRDVEIGFLFGGKKKGQGSSRKVDSEKEGKETTKGRPTP